MLALPVLLVLAACGTGSSSSTAPTTGVALLPARTPEPTPLTPSGGFIAMPSPQQVVEAQPHGRVDPFAPVGAATATEERTSSELQLTGLIGSGRSAQALISLGAAATADQTGELQIICRALLRGGRCRHRGKGIHASMGLRLHHLLRARHGNEAP